MVEPKRKNLSEFAVSLYTARWLILSAAQLTSGGTMREEEKSISDECHIYLICRLPSLRFCPDDFKYSDGKISGNLEYSIKGKKRLVSFNETFPLLEGATKIKVEDYPHREVRTYNDDGEVVRYLPANALCIGAGLHLKIPELHELEVMYVGQAFGDGTRSAFERLSSHSTLQKILADAQYESPDSEVYVLTFEYCPYRVVTHMDGRSAKDIPVDNDKARFFSILDNPLTDHQQICLAEASLIRYFEPKYNEIYKESFPSKKHKILESCYELDFSGLITEINTDELRFKLFSGRVPAKDHHIAQIDLIEDRERWGFFHLHDPEGKVSKYPGVIGGH